MSDAFELGGRTVRVPVPEGWSATPAADRLQIERGPSEDRPQATVVLALVDGADVPAVLERELESCVASLTDFTVLHLEARPARPENWPAGVAEVPFAFGSFRQGLNSLLVEVGVVAGDGTQAAVAYSVYRAEEAAGVEPDVDDILGGIEVEWA